FVQPLGASDTERVTAANQLYDLAVTALLREKDEQVAYEVDVVGLQHRSAGAYTFQVGQKVRIDYDGAVVGVSGTTTLLSVHTDLYVMAFSRNFDSSGADNWKLTVSTISRIVPGTNDLIVDFISKVTGQQVVPLPFVIFGDNVARFSPLGLELQIGIFGVDAPEVLEAKGIRHTSDDFNTTHTIRSAQLLSAGGVQIQ